MADCYWDKRIRGRYDWEQRSVSGKSCWNDHFSSKTSPSWVFPSPPRFAGTGVLNRQWKPCSHYLSEAEGKRGGNYKKPSTCKALTVSLSSWIIDLHSWFWQSLLDPALSLQVNSRKCNVQLIVFSFQFSLNSYWSLR